MSLAAGAVIEPKYSMSFDGTGDFLSFTNTTFAIDGSGDDLSVAFWAKRTDNNDEAVIFGLSSTGSYSRLNFDSDGDALNMESDKNGEMLTGAVTADTSWHHYVITAQGGGAVSTVQVYEDGAAVTSSAGNFGNSSGSDLTVNRIGDDNAAGNQAFKGNLFQVAIWTEVLNSDNVAAIYNSGSPLEDLTLAFGDYNNHGNIVHLWNFAEGGGSTTADSAGSLTATLNGNAAFSTDIPG